MINTILHQSFLDVINADLNILCIIINSIHCKLILLAK